ncbi:MAG: oligoribonuclease [Planctomycetes bacterium]|nr:oligoribonuclease [Planctomycetota bacterium]
MADEQLFAWMDLEMTGLEPDCDVILEVACLVTGPDLAPRDSVEHVIWQPPTVLDRMSDFVRDMHTRNGLLERVKASTTSLREAEDSVLALLARHCGPREAVLAGNSIHQDRRFIARYMPRLDAFLHYRQVDVSTLKVLARAWYPQVPKFEKPGKDHTALADLRDSLAELQFYRQHLLRPAP